MGRLSGTSTRGEQCWQAQVLPRFNTWCSLDDDFVTNKSAVLNSRAGTSPRKEPPAGLQKAPPQLAAVHVVNLTFLNRALLLWEHGLEAFALGLKTSSFIAYAELLLSLLRRPVECQLLIITSDFRFNSSSF